MPGGEHENMQAWSPEEDTIILEMHSQLGPLWSQIVRQLPGRTVSSVRNRWQRIAMLGGSANRENATRTVSFAPMAWRSLSLQDPSQLIAGTYACSCGSAGRIGRGIACFRY